MVEAEYENQKKIGINLFKKVRSVDPELADYLEQHFVMDDLHRTITYTGDDSVIDSMIQNSVIENPNGSITDPALIRLLYER